VEGKCSETQSEKSNAINQSTGEIMRTIEIRNIFFIAGFLMISVAAKSQTTDSPNYYLTIAEKNNPTVMQRYNEYQAALQKVPQVSSLPDPQLEMGFFLTPMELMAGNQIADIKLMQMFPWFGVIKNARDEMSLMAKAKYEAFVDAKLQMYLDVQTVWFDLYKVRKNITVSENNLKLLQSMERISIAKLKTGSGKTAAGQPTGQMPGSGTTGSAASGGMNGMSGSSGSGIPAKTSANVNQAAMSPSMSSGSSTLVEIYRLQSQMQELENSVLLLKNEEQVVQSRFNSLLNRNWQLSVAGPDSLIVEPLDMAWLTVTDSMFVQNPMLTMLKYDQLSIDARKKMQQKMGLPMVGVGLNYSVVSKNTASTSPMNGEDMIMPMVSISLPIYRKKYKAMQSESTYLKTASENNYQATVNALRTAYLEGLQQYFDAQRRMKLYEQQRELTQKSFDILLKSIAASTTGITDILQLQQQMLDIQLKQVNAVVDYNKAVSLLKRLHSNTTPNP